MLLSAQASRYAHQLLAARSRAQQLAPISDNPGLSLADAYDIAKNIRDIRIAQGETPVGRKIGFTNRAVWHRYDVTGPIWAPLFDATVRYATVFFCVFCLWGAVQPRIGPLFVFLFGV